MINEKLFWYRGRVTDIYDSDTVTIDLDLGCHVHFIGEKVRIMGIDTAEMHPRKAGRTEESLKKERAFALKAKRFTKKLLLGKEFLMKTFKDKRGKFGRILIDIWIKEPDEDLLESGVLLSEILIDKGYAHFYDGGKKQKWF